MNHIHDILIQLTYLIPNFWGTVPKAVNWAVVFFGMLAFVFAVKVIGKAFNLIVAAAVIVLAGHYWCGLYDERDRVR